MRNAFLVSFLVLAACATSAAQESRTAVITQQQQAKARELRPSQPKGQRVIQRFENLFTRGVGGMVPTFGGTRAGSGFAPGIAYVVRPGDAFIKTRALWSLKDTRRVQSTLTLPVARSIAIVDGFWEEAPDARWFGYGMGEASEITDRFESRGLSAEVELPRAGPFVFTTAAGYLKANTDSLGEASWSQASVGVAIDKRFSPDYTRTGFMYGIRAERVSAQQMANESFNRLTVDARQFLPFMNEHWVVALQVRAELTDAKDSTPYYLLPALGGGASLRGYPSFRYIGRQSVLGRAELRWSAVRTVDFAVFMDHGAVAQRITSLDTGDLARGWGVGARLHGDRSTGFRIDVARGREGWHLHLSRQASF